MRTETILEDAVSEFLAARRTVIPLLVEPFIRPVIEGFQKFLDEPQAYRDQWTFKDEGFIPRSGGMHDRKMLFHYRPTLPTQLNERNVDWYRHSQWLAKCHALYEHTADAMRNFNLALGKYFPLCNLENRLVNPGASALDVLRLLIYEKEGRDPSRPREVGKGHYDKDLTTGAIAQSHPGLWLEDQGNIWNSKSGEILVFPGLKFQELIAEYYPGFEFSALSHGVRVDDSLTENRWSIVFFSHVEWEVKTKTSL